MALTATVIRAKLSIADLNRHHYQDHSLTLAQHPSETDKRVLIRLLAFALFAQEGLGFSKGLCASDEPDIWIKDLLDQIELWIELGLPDAQRIKKACQRSKKVVLFCYDDNAYSIWYQKNKSKLTQANLTIYHIDDSDCQLLLPLYSRQLDLQVNINEDQLFLGSNVSPFQQIELQLKQIK
jgi:uncharacterized protein YaeQ